MVMQNIINNSCRLLVVFLAMVLASCSQSGSNKNSDKELGTKIEEQVAVHESVPLSCLTDYEWNSVVVLGPYAVYEGNIDALPRTVQSVVKVQELFEGGILLFFNDDKFVKYDEISASIFEKMQNLQSGSFNNSVLLE